MAARTKTQAKPNSTAYYIHSAIVLILMFGFQFLPEFGPLTHLGMQGLGIFLGLLWAWTFVDFIWPSLLGMVAIGFTGFMTIDEAFTAGFGNTTTIMIAIVFVLAAYLTSTGVCRIVAYWFVTRKITIGRPYVFMLFLFTAMYVIGGLAGTVATFVVGWAIIYEICDIIGARKREPLPASMLVGTVISALLGSTPWIFRPFAVMALNTAQKILGQTMSFVGWFVPSICASFAAVVLYVLAIKFIIRPDVSKLASGEDLFGHLRKEIKLTSEMKVGIVVVAAVIVLSCLPSFLPAGNAVKGFLSKFSVGPLIAMLLAIVYAIHKEGKPLTDYAKHMQNGIQWPTIIMLASSMPLGTLIQSKDSGISALINQGLTALLGGYDPFLISVIFIVFTIIVTQVAHNLVMMIVFAPILCNLSISMGFDAWPALIMLAFAANTGFATPGASIMGAMLFANREWISVKQAFAYTWLAVVVVGLCMCLIGIPVASVVSVPITVAA